MAASLMLLHLRSSTTVDFYNVQKCMENAMKIVQYYVRVKLGTLTTSHRHALFVILMCSNSHAAMTGSVLWATKHCSSSSSILRIHLMWVFQEAAEYLIETSFQLNGAPHSPFETKNTRWKLFSRLLLARLLIWNLTENCENYILSLSILFRYDGER